MLGPSLPIQSGAPPLPVGGGGGGNANWGNGDGPYFPMDYQSLF